MNMAITQLALVLNNEFKVIVGNQTQLSPILKEELQDLISLELADFLSFNSITLERLGEFCNHVIKKNYGTKISLDSVETFNNPDFYDYTTNVGIRINVNDPLWAINYQGSTDEDFL